MAATMLYSASLLPLGDQDFWYQFRIFMIDSRCLQSPGAATLINHLQQLCSCVKFTVLLSVPAVCDHGLFPDPAPHREAGA